MFRLFITFSILLLGTTDCFDICGDWTPYKDSKCIKDIYKFNTEARARQRCSQLNSTLLTVHDQEEREFIIKFLKQIYNSKELERNVWIDMKYGDRPYKWTDNGTVISYWLNDRDTCAQLVLASNKQGSMRMASCYNWAIIVCERKQELNLNVVRYLIEEQEKQAHFIKQLFHKVKELDKKHFATDVKSEQKDQEYSEEASTEEGFNEDYDDQDIYEDKDYLY